MSEIEIRRLAREHLAQFAQTGGWLTFSGLSALKPSDFYLMGYNPAADGTNPKLSEPVLRDGPWSAYLHNCWQSTRKDGVKLPCGHSWSGAGTACPKCGKQLGLHQKQVRKLLDGIAAILGEPLDLTEVFSANAIFVESTSVETLPDSEAALWRSCWPIHQYYLNIVRPRWIICLGNSDGSGAKSAFKLLRAQAGLDASVTQKERIDNTTLWVRWFDAEFDLESGKNGVAHKVRVIGVPHPSRPRKIPETLAAMAKAVAQS
jgi:hypothetical protein